MSKPFVAKYFLLSHGRPIGVEPTIYTSLPELGEDDGNPWHPSILYFDNIQAALICILNFNPTDEYLKELRIK